MLLQAVKRIKMKHFGHHSRKNRREEEARRPRISLMTNIAAWKEMKSTSAMRACEDRDNHPGASAANITHDETDR